jgi:nickel-dependent lactate racemase
MSVQSPKQIELSFGDQRRSLIVSDNMRCFVECELPAIVDLASAIKTACDAPLNFPPISQAVFTGDKVALAVDSNMSRIDSVVSGIVEYLISSGTSPKDITVVLSKESPVVFEKLAAVLSSECAVKSHDPDDMTELAYVGAEEIAEPIYVNRTLVDADVVIPCLVCRQSESFGYGGPGGIVPDFVDRNTQKRFESQIALQESALSYEYGNSMAKVLGVMASIVVVPGADDSIVSVIAGTPTETMMASQVRLIQALPNATTGTFELVISMIDGGQRQQTWDNVARAIVTAQSNISKSGSIVVVTQMETRVEGALTILAGIDSEAKMYKRIAESTLANSAVAKTVLDVRTRNPIFLLSRLKRNPIESIGLGFVEDFGEIERLAKKVSSCLVLGSAQNRSRFDES